MFSRPDEPIREELNISLNNRIKNKKWKDHLNKIEEKRIQNLSLNINQWKKYINYVKD